MDLFQKCYDYKRVDMAKAWSIYPYFHELNSGQSDVVEMEGRRTIMLGSNNYLGLTSDPRVKAAAIKAIEEYGTGCSGSRFLNGTLDLHVRFEEEQAEFLKKEACLTFSTGFQSNLSIISSITGRNDAIISDSFNHASIVDGMRLSFAKQYKFPHSDMNELERMLKRCNERGQGKGGDKGGILIITDGVFSMEGDICNLPKIVELARKYGARILVDDAHALGVLGERGAGTAEYFGLEDEVDLIMNTFSKSYASLGGCVAGEAKVIEYIKHVARPFIFSASLPPGQIAAAHEALRILKSEPERVARIHELTADVQERLKKLPYVEVRESNNNIVPIIPIKTGTVVQTLYISKLLLEAGVYVNPVLPPA
ncbi:MAG TPA: aminotransferase class I/II-fold pyridoxal phosphate-dependent enzyme, partial [Clostridiaceae bacterium]|nr:aminotransferase class I/II-fold pyridoxal phosphate-dependent enzyme [Clostridiaceae bacterium]